MTSLAAASAPRSRLAFGLGVAALVVALDQVTKWLVLDLFAQSTTRVVEVTSFFNLVLTFNYGVSFGMFAHEEEYMPYVLSLVALVIAGFLANWLRRTGRTFVALGLGLVIGGALGNIVDRLWYGAVVDFLDFHAAGWHFWAFNVADSGISVGVVILLIDGLFNSPETS